MNRIIRDTPDLRISFSNFSINSLMFKDQMAAFGVDYYKLTEDEIREKADSLNWDYISQCSPIFKFSDEFFQDYSSELDWDDIIERKEHKEDFIYKFYDKLDWENPNLKDNSYSEDLIDFLIEKVKFPLQSNLYFSKPSEEFIRKYLHKISNMTDVAINCKVGNSFLEEFKEQINWKKFIKEVKSLTEETLESFKDHIDWYEFSQNFTAADDIIEKYESYIFQAVKRNQKERFEKKIKKGKKDDL